MNPMVLLNEFHFIDPGTIERRYTWKIVFGEWRQDPYSLRVLSDVWVDEFAPVLFADQLTITMLDLRDIDLAPARGAEEFVAKLEHLVESQIHVAVACLEWAVEELWLKAVLPPHIPSGE